MGTLFKLLLVNYFFELKLNKSIEQSCFSINVNIRKLLYLWIHLTDNLSFMTLTVRKFISVKVKR